MPGMLQRAAGQKNVKLLLQCAGELELSVFLLPL